MTGVRRRILVVEDDSETAEQIVDFLRTRGYQADLAMNGNDGLRLGHSAEYAVMTIDRMLPGMDGLAIIRHLRESKIVIPRSDRTIEAEQVILRNAYDGGGRDNLDSGDAATFR